MVHNRSKLLHLCNQSEEVAGLERRYFKCGRIISKNFALMSERDSGNQLCILQPQVVIVRVKECECLRNFDSDPSVIPHMKVCAKCAHGHMVVTEL